jgi:hypothetical protein
MGVIIYSKIMTEIISEMEKSLLIKSEIRLKMQDLHLVCSAMNVPFKEKARKELIREIILSSKEGYLQDLAIPKFPGVNKKDVEDLLH